MLICVLYVHKLTGRRPYPKPLNMSVGTSSGYFVGKDDRCSHLESNQHPSLAPSQRPLHPLPDPARWPLLRRGTQGTQLEGAVKETDDLRREDKPPVIRGDLQGLPWRGRRADFSRGPSASHRGDAQDTKGALAPSQNLEDQTRDHLLPWSGGGEL